MSLESKFSGCILGVGIGDSLGRGWEGHDRVIEDEVVKRSSGLLRYTDDTHMTLGVLESLIECKGLDVKHMALTFIKNYEAEPYRGYGPGPPRIFKRIGRGDGLLDLDRDIYPGGSWGNGSAMRIAPIGLLYHDTDVIRKRAYRASRITHSHELGMEGAALQAYAVALAVNGVDKRRFPGELELFTVSDLYREKLRAIKDIDRSPKSEVVSRLGNGIEALSSVPTAIFSFLKSASFSDAVLYAISLGGDTDTIGSMTGAIAGAYYGKGDIPEKWIEGLENREYLESLALRLLALRSDS